MGCDRVRECLPPLVRAVQTSGKHVLWVSDPVHGNTKVRRGGKHVLWVSDPVHGNTKVSNMSEKSPPS